MEIKNELVVSAELNSTRDLLLDVEPIVPYVSGLS